MAHLWTFEALDTWFFRESRPFETIGGAQLASYFPPPVRSLAGAVRTAIGEHQGVNWHEFNSRDERWDELRAAMGDAASYGQLKVRGPFLMRDGERLYPAPLLLLEKNGRFVRLQLDTSKPPVQCDLGCVQLPVLAKEHAGASPLENVWLTRAGLEKVLCGGEPLEDKKDAARNEVWRRSTLLAEEERLGIGRNNERRTNADGLLYQTRHLRPHEGISLGVEVRGLEDKWHPPRGVIRLGGEGRLAAFTTAPAPDDAPKPQPGDSTKVLLTLLTPALFDMAAYGNNGMPPGFTRESRDGCDVWKGETEGVSLTIVSAVLGRAVREGGWDMARHRPRDLTSLVPAGSCYFCESDLPAAEVAALLQGRQIGGETELGRGEIAVGTW